ERPSGRLEPTNRAGRTSKRSPRTKLARGVAPKRGTPIHPEFALTPTPGALTPEREANSALEAGLRLGARLGEAEDRGQAEEVEHLLHVRRGLEEHDVPVVVLGAADGAHEHAGAGGRDVVE